MAPRYDSDGVLPTRAIYPASRPLPYIALLLMSKALKGLGLYLLYDLLKLVHVVVLLFLVLTGSSVILVLLQKPFSSGKPLTGNQWARVVRGAVIESLTCLLWLFGLTLTGPLRATLLYEHNYVVVTAAGAALISGTGGPSKSRGTFFLLLAVVGILFFDHDYEGHRSQENLTNSGGQESHHDSFFTHLFYHLLNISGLSDHKGGVVLLVCTLLLNTLHGAATRKLSVEVGGAKRLNALTCFVSFLIMAPWAAVMYFTTESVITSSFIHLIVPLTLTILFVFVIDYYMDGLAAARLEVPRAARIGTLAIFVSALVLSSLWSHPFVASLTTTTKYQELITEDHVLSAGVVFSFILLVFATTSLTSPSAPAVGGSRGALAGLSAAAGGAPLLLSYAEEALLHGSQSVLSMAKSGLRQILEDINSRRIFYFLCINLAFTFVELLYGAWTNSLGLISDGFHMLFDCSALVMGLYASVMSRWKATRIFSFGYDRLEVLSGFVNGLFLVVIAFFVFIAALERLHDPPSIDTERLLPVSVAGLCVNMIGICAFSHAHSHGGAHGHSHGGSHSHGGAACSSSSGSGSHGHAHGAGASSNSCSHGHSEVGHGHSHDVAGHHSHSNAQDPCRGENGSHHGHSHGTPGGASTKAEKKVHNTNMEGVYLHVLADTMSSVGVIISTLLMEYFGWFIADPICSLFIAAMIGLSVLPLLKETASILLLCTPPDLLFTWQDVVRKIVDVDGVLAVREHHFWSHSSSVSCGTVRVHVKSNASEQVVLAQVSSLLKAAGLKNTAVQVEKDDYVQHVIGLTAGQPLPLKAANSAGRSGEEIKNV